MLTVNFTGKIWKRLNASLFFVFVLFFVVVSITISFWCFVRERVKSENHKYKNIHLKIKLFFINKKVKHLFGVN